MKKGKWSDTETDFLIKNYRSKTDKEIGKVLDRDEISVRNKRIKMNLSKNIMDSINITCLNCNKIFSIPYSRKEAYFCCRKCKGEYQKRKSGSLRNCETCGKEFYAKGNPSQFHIYCSKECSYEGRKKGEYVQCDNCGKEIYKQNSAITRSKHLFCCTECATDFQRHDKIKISCKVCGKEFEVHLSTMEHSIKRNQKIQYCSMDCRNNDSDRIDLLRRLNDKQNKNKNRNKLENEGSKILDDLQIEYLEQYLVNGKISVDIYIPKYNLIIEWWGDYWHGHESKLKNGIADKRQIKRMALDISQAQYLKKCNYSLLTFWEHEVYHQKDKVINTIKNTIRALSH